MPTQAVALELRAVREQQPAHHPHDVLQVERGGGGVRERLPTHSSGTQPDTPAGGVTHSRGEALGPTHVEDTHNGNECIERWCALTCALMEVRYVSHVTGVCGSQSTYRTRRAWVYARRRRGAELRLSTAASTTSKRNKSVT